MTMWPLLFSLALSADQVVSEIAADEVVVFYPTYAHQTSDEQSWVLHIHGRIFEPEDNSIKRAALIALLRRTFRLSKEDEASETFQTRFRAFLVDNERNKTIHVRIGNQVYRAGKSGANGHFSSDLVLSNETIEAARLHAPTKEGLSFTAVVSSDDHREFAGQVQLIGRQGLSVISDVDDTIKISNVRDRRALLAHTFLRPYRAVPGMADIYGRCQQAGAVFHYVSASPWQLYEPIREFLSAETFPAGSLQMKVFRLKDQSALALLGAHHEYKGEVIAKILNDFPERRFTLVGDSSEQDPEIYGELARHYKNVAHVLIRLVSGDTASDTRFAMAFKDLPASRWQLFGDPVAIKAVEP
jgi:phosphatidate phosphatase APP1